MPVREQNLYFNRGHTRLICQPRYGFHIGSGCDKWRCVPTSTPMKHLFLWLGLISACFPLYGQYVTLNGYVRAAESGEALVGSTVRIGKQGTYSNRYGFFSLTLPQGEYKLLTAYIGFVTDTLSVVLDQDLTLDIRLQEGGQTTDEVVISASKSAYAREVVSPQMSQISLDIDDLKLVPTIAGEADVLKVIQLLPGVTKGGEGTTSILVRGGDPDQNLILLDESVVYNVSHLFGFFSVFNPDALKDLTLIKGGFPAQYGGRLSSVLDINMNEGNQRCYNVKGGIGLLSSRLTVEGPIVKDKASFSVSGRRTYIDQVLGVVGINVPYYFYDLNAKVNARVGEKDRIFLSAYLGDDILSASGATDVDSVEVDVGEVGFGFRLGNLTTTLRWNHLFSDKLIANNYLIITRYKYDINGTEGDNSIFVGSNVVDIGLKSDYSYYPSPLLTFRWGGQYIRHRFRPNVISAQGDISGFINVQEVPSIFADELAIYGQHEWQIQDQLKVQYGLRLSASLVPNKTYVGPEPRASVVYILNDQHSFKAGYALMRQYLHLVSSSTVALPTDLWYPVTATVRPQRAHQVAGSYTHHFEKPGLLLTVEGYYKWMFNLTEYREGANLILNNNFEDELLQGKGISYGGEFLLKRDEGRIRGWIGYTLSYTRRQFDELNGGNWFWAKYDRRHDVSVVAIFKLNDRIDLSAVYTFLSGARFTPQIGQYLVPTPDLTGVELIPIYSDRNAVRSTSAQRFDLNLTLRNRPTKRFRSSFTFGVYNLFNAPTPISIRTNYSPEQGVFYDQPSFLGRVLSIAWNFDINFCRNKK